MSDYSDLIAALRKKVGPIVLEEVLKLQETQTIPANDLGPGSVERSVAAELQDIGNPVVRYGAKGDGSTDDRGAFATAELSASGYDIPAGTYRLASNITLAASLRFAPGAVLRPAGGVTVTLNGPISAGHHQIFDTSLGGVFAGTPKVPAINMMWFGADITGVTNESAKVRAAQALGSVYFPTGAYLLTTVNLLGNRRYFGDGVGRTIIKHDPAGTSSSTFNTFVIGTINTDGFFTPQHVNNVEICHLTFDFNFSGGWIGGGAGAIRIRGGQPAAGFTLTEIEIHHCEFIDSFADITHTGPGSNEDAWCINVPGQPTGLYIHNNTFRARYHQAIAGGGTGARRWDIHHNRVEGAHQNGITCSTIGGSTDPNNPWVWEDIRIHDNHIRGWGHMAILVGYDPGPTRPVTYIQLRDIHVYDNVLVQDDFDAAINSAHQAVVINVPDGTHYNLTSERNSLQILSTAVYSSFTAGRLVSADLFNRSTTTTSADFTQPAIGATVDIALTSVTHSTGAAVIIGSVIAVNGGGYYQVTAIDGNTVTAKRMDYFNAATAGATIASGAIVKFMGGIAKRCVIRNISGANRDFLIYGTLEDCVFQDNVDVYLRFQCNHYGSIIKGNSRLQLELNGNSDGIVADNSLLPIATSGTGVINFDLNVDANTGFNEIANVDCQNNILHDGKAAKTTDVAIGFQGTVTSANIRLFSNLVWDTTGRGLEASNVPVANQDNTFNPRATGFAPPRQGTIREFDITLSYDLSTNEYHAQNLTATGVIAGDLVVGIGIPSDTPDGVAFTARCAADVIRLNAMRATTVNPAAQSSKAFKFFIQHVN